jgi:hypothetical protein
MIIFFPFLPPLRRPDWVFTYSYILNSITSSRSDFLDAVFLIEAYGTNG